MRWRNIYMASLFGLGLPLLANANDWPEGLLPKQIFKVEVSENAQIGSPQDKSLSGMGFAVTDKLLLVPREVITENSRFEDPMSPNRQIEMHYVEDVQAGADVKTWKRFKVLPTDAHDLVLLQVMDGPPLSAMGLSVCKDQTGPQAIYILRNGDLSNPVEITMEHDASRSIGIAGLDSFVVQSANDQIEKSDVGAPLVDQTGQVVGVISRVSSEKKAVVTYTESILNILPNHIEIGCSDRFNSTDYAKLKADFETLQGEVSTLTAALSDLQAKQKADVLALEDALVQLRSDLTRNERTAFAAVSAIKSFDEKIEKIDLATAEKLLNEFKGSKPIQPRLDQISKDLGDVTWSFRVLPNEIEQTISLVARYNRQLSLVPFSKIMAVCVTPLRQPADLANAPSKDNIENAVFYEELDGELRASGRIKGSKCKRNEHKNPLKQTKSGEYTFNFDAEFDDDWNGLAYVQFYQTLPEVSGDTSAPKAEIVRRMVVGVSIENEDVITPEGNMSCFDFSKENPRAVDAWDDIAFFLKTAPEDRGISNQCG